MYQDNHEMLQNIRKIRANMVRRYLSLGFVDSKKPSLSLDPSVVESLIEHDEQNRPLWEQIQRYLSEQTPDMERFEKSQYFHKLINLIEAVETDNALIDPAVVTTLVDQLLVAKASSASIAASLQQEVKHDLHPEDSEELVLLTPEVPAAEVSREALGDVDFKGLTTALELDSIYELQKELAILDNNPQPVLSEAHREHIAPFIALFETHGLPDLAADFTARIAEKGSRGFTAYIELVDLLDAIKSGFTFEDQIFSQGLYQALTHYTGQASFIAHLRDLLAQVKADPSVIDKRSFAKKFTESCSALSSNAIIELPIDTLRDLANPLSSADEYQALLENVIAHTEHESHEVTESTVAAPKQAAQDANAAGKASTHRHPYYLTGETEVSLKDVPDYDDELLNELKESYREEVETEVFPLVEESLEKLKEPPYDDNTILDLRRAFHTLKGSGYMSGFMYEGEIAWYVESVLNGCRDKKYAFSEAIWHHANDGYTAIKKLLAGEEVYENELFRIVYQAEYLMEHDGQIPVQEAPAIMLQDDDEFINQLRTELQEKELPLEEEIVFEPVHEEIVDDSELVQNILTLIDGLESGSYNTLHHLTEDLRLLLHNKRIEQNAQANSLVKAVNSNALLYLAHGLSPQRRTLSLWKKALESAVQAIEGRTVSQSEFQYYIETLSKRIIEYPALRDSSQKHDDSNEIDNELLELFTEEALEILENTDDVINEWRATEYDPTSPLLGEFRRLMHTLKGSSRMVGKEDIGQLSHALESLLDQAYIALFSKDPRRFDLLQRALDHIPTMLENKTAQMDQEAYNILSSLHLLLGNETPPEMDLLGKVEGDEKITEVTEETSSAAQAELGAIRVSPNKLSLISENIAENIILNAQQQRSVNQILSSIEELDRTIGRVNSQARRIEIEMEAQMVSRHARLADHGEFDPLELDRFSELQQLTRLIMESAGDLDSLRKTIDAHVNTLTNNLEKQSLLQSFVNQTLNEVRTDNFQSIIPRLRRLIRQVSKVHDKTVELTTEGTDIFVERMLLEQMLTPFEHMIRNSIIHGIEDPETRKASGKESTGNISIHVTKHGPDLVIRFADDGAGIDIETARQKAVELGKIKADEKISDQRLIELLMLPGMTTAKSLSQDAGRGVGLDILAKALVLLNARLSVENMHGKGLAFEIAVPYSLTTLQTLLVSIGTKQVAIPLDNIIAIDKLDNEKIVNNMANYQGESYEILPIGRVYGDLSFGQTKEKNIYLFYSIAGRKVALEIDRIVAQQDMIMRPLNPQIAHIPGISGSSLLPDGSIIYIIDIQSIIKNEKLLSMMQDMSIDAHADESEKAAIPTVLIVDDSITMRKVSSRMVERMGLQWKAAKDGIDAVEKLETFTPDLIMLDIEMPKMDGFEVLAHLRARPHLVDVPVIMVTSRTGEKHKERAISLGANEYCGKPYQEAQITAIIEKLLGDKMNHKEK
ncbi:MAG: response regulator [Xanthomonadaceae bacterium]|nr:response regulator [Xanthomonadaceae bacterium]